MMLFLSGCTTAAHPAKTTSAATCGSASWYGNEFHGRRTASGAVFNQNAMTTAHRTLPFGTKLRVSYRGNTVVVTVNDRGPFTHGRVLDLSKGAAKAVGLKPHGTGKVCYERLK